MRAFGIINDALLAQRGMLLCWVPICLGIGISIYFGLSREPSLTLWIGLAACIAALSLIGRVLPIAIAPICIGLVLVGCGAGLAKFRTESVAASVLSFRYYGPIAGRVINIDRSASDAVRLTLDHVQLDMARARTPTKIRVSVHGDQPLDRIAPGDHLVLTGHLSPPSGPAEPGGYDFQRHAWFAGLGGVGYTRTPVLRSAPPARNWDIWVFEKRIAISRTVQDALPGETGAFAAAIMTGDRAAMSQDTLQNLRDSNLAHLLAISGLHMGLLTGFVFGVLRFGMALVPGIALIWSTKKIAASCAIIVGACYLALSGGNVATERAFIMVTTMFVAVLLDRRALTLRAVAIAATLVLILRPEVLSGPGFQMSFAATTALVVVFRAIRGVDSGIPKWARAPLSVVISSGVAGLATAPFAAAHFNQVSHFGLIANVVSVPLMGAVVMPAAVLAVCLVPIGQWHIGLTIMDVGLRWILYVARTVSSWDGAVGYVVAPGGLVLPLLSSGLVFFVVWVGRGRWLGAGVVTAAFAVWLQSERPAVLIADNGNMIGVLGPEGRALSRDRGSSFVASIWLENDGAPVEQTNAAARPGLEQNGRVWMTNAGGLDIMKVTGKIALAELQDCGGADILVTNQTDTAERSCLVFDVLHLRAVGSVAIFEEEGLVNVVTARSQTGVRPWNMVSVDPDYPVRMTIRKTENGPQLRPAFNVSEFNQYVRINPTKRP